MAHVKGMKLSVLDCGYTLMDSNFIIAMDTYMTEAEPNAPRHWHKCPTYCVLIQHPMAGNILFDLGTRWDNPTYAPKHIAESDIYHGNQENDLTVQLGRLGLSPKDIAYVVVSHMHYDHIGNYHLVKDTAEFFISRAELNNAFTAVCVSRNPVEHGFYIRWEVTADFQRVNIVEEDSELFEGITALLLPGHTPGVMGLLVEAEENNYLLVSDALYCQANYDGIQPGLIEDSVAFHKSLQKIKSLQKKYHAQVWFGHDGEQFDQMKKAPEWYK